MNSEEIIESVMIPRTIKTSGEVYININDLIRKIEDHKNKCKSGGIMDIIYGTAHDHIIELISIYKDQ